MADEQIATVDNTAERVALWRAMHVLVDPPPHVLEDVVGLQLADPAEGWRDRGDMHPEGTSRFRAAIVARARFIEDLVADQAAARCHSIRDSGHPTSTRSPNADPRSPPDSASSKSTSQVPRPGSASA